MSDAEIPGRTSAAIETGTTGDLVRAAQQGDARAFEALIRAHHPLVHRAAWRWLGNGADAEDVAQQVWIKLGSTLAGYDHRAAFTTWLYRVTLNAVRDWQRSEIRRQRRTDALIEITPDHQPADQDSALRLADIWKAVRALPPRQRDAVLLLHGEELSQAEAAKIMGCREITVAWHLHQARKALREVLQ